MFKTITQKLTLNRILAYCFIFVLSLTFVSSLLRPETAAAVSIDYTYTSATYQTIKGPSQPGGSDEATYKRLAAGYYQATTGAGCSLTIRTKNGKDGDTNATWESPCTTQSKTITIQPPTSNVLRFNWVNSGEIDSADGRKYVADSATTTQAPNIFYQTNADEGKCKDQIDLRDKSNATLVIRIENASSDKDAVSKAQQAYDYNNIAPNLNKAVKVDGCWVINQVGITLGNVDNANLPPGGGGSQQPSCESAGGGALSWVICPVIEMLDSAANWLDSQIQSLLIVPNPASLIDARDGKNHLEQAWGRIRNIALIILVPIMLVMVLGTALGFSFLDAYTVRRAMPRLLIAILFISLSWIITSFLVGFTNAIGQSVLGLVTQPFGGSNQSLADLINPVFAGGVSWGGLVIFGGMFAAGLVSLGIILSVALVVVVVLFIGFALLTLRQLLIFGLILLAPLAILSWIFPSNDKMWKLWWDSFSKLLLMFPLIMLIIGVGKAFALIISSTGSAYQGLDGLLLQLMIIVAYVAPYFFIPAAFRAAGGLFSTITGMVNDRGRGLFDRQRKYRQEERARQWERKGGTRLLQARGAAYRGLQRQADKRGGVAGALLRTGSMAVGGAGMEAALSARTAARSKELNDIIATGKDGEIRGLTAGYAMDYARKHGMQAAVDAGLASIGDDGSRSYKSLGGAMVSESEVLAGQRRWGHDRFAQQAALSYEMKKAIKDEDIENITSHYGDQVESWGMSDDQARGAWIGAGFENQNQHLEFKHTKWVGKNNDKSDHDKAGNATGLNFSGAAMATETAERRGSYNLSQLSAHSLGKLRTAFDDADNEIKQQTAVLAAGVAKDDATGGVRPMTDAEYKKAQDKITEAQATKAKVKSTMETFMSRYGSGGEVVADGEDVRYDPAKGGGRSPVQSNAPGAGHVAEVAREVAEHVGVYTPNPPVPPQK